MIVYYDPIKLDILGMSGVVDPNRNEPYFETSDQRAVDVFLGKDKISRYEVLLDPDDNKKGYLKVKHSNILAKPIEDRIYLIPKKLEIQPDILIKQNKETKEITINFSESALIQLRDLKSTIQLYACVSTDPYEMYWVKYIQHTDLLQSLKFNYQGADNFNLFTDRLLGLFYHHECS